MGRTSKKAAAGSPPPQVKMKVWLATAINDHHHGHEEALASLCDDDAFDNIAKTMPLKISDGGTQTPFQCQGGDARAQQQRPL